METLWKHCDCDLRFKLIAYDAVTRARLMYVLESLQLNQEERKKTDRFQLRGLRQILKLKTTYGQMQSHLARSNDNETVLRLANAKINLPEDAWVREFKKRSTNTIEKMSDYYERQRRNSIIDIINMEPTGPNRDP